MLLNDMVAKLATVLSEAVPLKISVDVAENICDRCREDRTSSTFCPLKVDFSNL